MECVEINNVFAEGNAEVMETAVNDPGKKHWAAQGRAVEWQDRDMNKDTANKPLNLFLEAQTGSVSHSWTSLVQNDTFKRHLRDSEGGIPNLNSSELT